MRRSRAPLTLLIAAIITVVFVIEWQRGATNDPAVLVSMGAVIHEALLPGERWRLIAAAFLHVNAVHYFVNLVSLIQLGFLFESLFGSRRFITTYVISAVIASVVSAIHLDPGHSAAGASGAIFGLMGALIVALRRSPQFRRDPSTSGIVHQLIVWAVVNLAIGFSIPQIDNGAHIGGLVAGLLLGLYPHRVPPPPPAEGIIETTAVAHPPISEERDYPRPPAM